MKQTTKSIRQRQRGRGGRRFFLTGLFFTQFALMILICPPQADAAARRRVFFQLANLRHWADLEYSYEGNTNKQERGTQSSRDHEFTQAYHLEIDYAIFNHRITNGSMELDLGMEQNVKSISGSIDKEDQSNSLNVEYLIELNFFERRPYPFSFLFSEQRERVDEPFTDNYDLVNRQYSVLASSRYDYFPVQLRARHFETETEGLERNRNQETDEISLETEIEHGELGQTRARGARRVNVTQLDNSTSSGETKSYEYEIDNTLGWEAWTRSQVLRSRYRMQRDSGLSDYRTRQWDERLDIELGKALESGLTYQRRDTEIRLEKRSAEEKRGWIEHQLYKSLTTRIERFESESEYESGEESLERNQVSLLYTKKLPAESRLRMSYLLAIGEVDRDLEAREIGVTNELLTAQIDDNYLQQRNIIESSVQVFSQDRSFLYVEGVDYTLERNEATRQLEVVFFLPFPSGGISSGQVLSIDYRYEVNNSIVYSTTLNRASASVSLFNNRYRIYGTFSQSDEDLIAGEENVSPLINQNFYLLGAEANFDHLSFGGSYQYTDSTLSKEAASELTMNYFRELKNAMFQLGLTERYIQTTGKEGGRSSRGRKTSNNSLRLNAEYRRRLKASTDLTLRGHIIDYRGDGEDKDDLFLGALFESRWYKFLFRVSADVSWEFYDENRSREDRFYVGLRRYF